MTVPQVIQNLRTAGNTVDADEIERLQQFDGTLARLGGQLTQAEQAIAQLTGERDTAMTARDNAVTAQNEAVAERDGARAERDTAARAYAQLEASSIAVRVRVAELEDQLAQARNDAMTREQAAKAVATARKDLIRRLIAVAISVGFASRIVTLHVIAWWNGTPSIGDPTSATLARLVTALLVILLGWDWYDRDVEAKPLTRIFRFLLDAFVVVTQLVLLLSSAHADLWSWLLVIIFGSYVVWDVASVVDHPATFGFPAPRQNGGRAVIDVMKTYWGGFWGEPRRRGATINLGWLVYFVVVLILLPRFLPFPGKYGPYVTCLQVAIGAWLLWCEGVRDDDGAVYFKLRGRVIAWLLLIGSYVAYPVGYMIYRYIHP